jgi:hypothetical protein
LIEFGSEIAHMCPKDGCWKTINDIDIFLGFLIDVLDVGPRSRISRRENVTYVMAANAAKKCGK